MSKRECETIQFKKYIIHLDDGQEDAPVASVWHPEQAKRIMAMMQQMIEIMNKCNERASQTESSAQKQEDHVLPQDQQEPEKDFADKADFDFERGDTLENSSKCHSAF